MSAAKKKADNGLRREAPPAVIAVAIVLALCAVGAGVFYLMNNGWKTQAQKDYSYTHEMLPVIQLHHGDRRAFDEENAQRKREGRPPLVDEMDKQPSQAELDVAKQRLARLRAEIATHPQDNAAH